MKRCPECKFVYMDSDQLCDLDGAQLVYVSDAEFDAAISGDARDKKAQSSGPRMPAPHRNRKAAVATAVGVVVGLVLLFFYLSLSRKSQHATQVPEQSRHEVSPSPVATPQRTPASESRPLTSPSLETTPSPGVKPTISSHPSANRTNMSSNPVSTSAAESAKTGPMLVRLTNGATIEADEVWRTKEGVWYRRNGIVTLIKANRVKAIEKPR
jgi:hypothetical protein